MITDLLPGDALTVGGYKLHGRLGEGGMGVVYLARSPGGRPVAIKVVKPQFAGDSEFRARFAREVSAARKVSGLFTALVVAADADAPLPWLATAYVAGPSLADAVRERGPLPSETVLQLAAGLTEGLQAIHAAGLVHRDLKPTNVLLAADGPRVIDFGISKARDASMLTQRGEFVGTPGYNSPEQVDGFEVGPPSDIFSLGGVLTYAATGVGPFGDGPPLPLMHRVLHNDPDLSAVPDVVRPLIERCLAKDPAARPTPAELLAQLDELGAVIGVATDEWLPREFAATIDRYVPTLGTVVRADEAVAVEAEPPVTAGAAAELAGATIDVMPGFPSASAPAGQAGDPIAGAPTEPPDHNGSDTAPGRMLTPQRRRLLLASAAAVVVIASVATGLGLSDGGPSRAADGQTPLVDVTSAATASRTPSSAPTHSASPTAKPTARAKPSKRATHPAKRAKKPKTASSTAPGQTPTTAATTAAAPAPTTAPPPAPTTAPPTTPSPRHSPTPTPTPKRSSAPAQALGGYAGASNFGCVGSLPSKSGGARVSYTFINDSAADVELFEYSTSGALVGEGSIGPGSSDPVSTAVGYFWEPTGQAGLSDCLGEFQIDSSGSLTVVS